MKTTHTSSKLATIRKNIRNLTLGLASTSLLAVYLAHASDGGGLAQSPINIETANVTFVEELPELEFNYCNRIPITVLNTSREDNTPIERLESTIRCDIPEGGGSLTVAGKTYRLLQFHFHHKSEHQLNGKATDMNIHLVHQASDGELLVVEVFLEKGRRNRQLKKVLSPKRIPTEPQEVRNVKSFNLWGLLPDCDQSYRYDGSLTTPPFTEGVKWVVLQEPITIGKKQLESFLSLEIGEARPPQPLNGREILSDVDLDDEDEDED